MLRATLLALLLANAGYFAWSQGLLAGLGDWAQPEPQREPMRLDRQIQAERLTVLSPASSPSADRRTEAQAQPTETQCLQASGLTDAQADGLRTALADTLPEDSWQLDTTVQPARWVVYLGKFSSAEALRARKAELRAAKVDHRDVNNLALQPGLALGTFPSEAAAQQALRDVVRGGIKNAKVVSERAESRQHTLTVPQATPAQREALQKLSGAPEGSPLTDLKACPG